MADFHWDETYRLGFPEMDEQHRTLFGMLEELEAAVAAGVEPRQVPTLLERVRQDAVYHFAAEETFLAREAFPGLVQQRVQHRIYLKRLRRLEAEVDEGASALDLAEVHALESWILGHVVGLDREYAEFLAKRGAAGSSE